MIAREYAWAAGGIFLVLYLLFLRSRKIKPERRTVILHAVMIVYLTVVISLTFFPLVYVNDGTRTMEKALQLKPFRTISNMWQYGSDKLKAEQLLGNVLLTLPWGFLLPQILKKTKHRVIPVLILAFTVSIEAMQLILGGILGSYYRMCDIDDVILNFFGGMLGYCGFLLLRRIKKCIADKSI